MRSTVAPAITPMHLVETNESGAAVMVHSSSMSSVTVRSSEDELEVMAAAVVLQKRRELKEIELLEAEGQTRLAAIRSARGSKASSARSGQLGRELVSGKTVREEIAARERLATSGGPGPALSSGSSFRRVVPTKVSTAEEGTPAHTNNMYILRNVLDQSCVVESWRSVQSEVHQEKARLASEVEAMQATANVKHDEIVRQVAQGSWDAARREAKAAIDVNEEQCWAAVQQAEAVAEYSQQAAQRVSSEAGEQLRFAQQLHTREQSEVAALLEELRSRTMYEETLRQALQDADVVLREQVAKAYQDGLEQPRSVVSGRSLSHYSIPSEKGDNVERHPIFTPVSGVTADQGGSLGLSSSNWPIAPTLVSTAASFTAPLRAAVGSVLASTVTMTQTEKPKSSNS